MEYVGIDDRGELHVIKSRGGINASQFDMDCSAEVTQYLVAIFSLEIQYDGTIQVNAVKTHKDIDFNPVYHKTSTPVAE